MNVLRHWSDEAVNRVADRLRNRGRLLPVNADTVRLVVHEAEAVPVDLYRGAVAAERERIVGRLREMAGVLDPDDVSRTALTLEKAAAVLTVEGGQ